MMESRGADRIEIAASASFRRGAGLAQSATVADLTRGGCRLIDIPRTLSRGEKVSLRIGGVGPIVGEIRWLKLGREAGVEFTRPLSEAIYAALVNDRKKTPLDPYRAEIMELHNTFAQSEDDTPAEPLSAEAEQQETAAAEPQPAVKASESDNVVALPTAAIAPAPASPINVGEEKRRSTRFDAGSDPAVCDDPERGPVDVKVIDFSQHGLRIGHEGIEAAPGTRISLVFPDSQVVEGEVRWNDGSHLGVQVVEIREQPVRAPRFLIEEPCVGEPVARTETSDPAEMMSADDLPDLPDEQLARFAKLLEAARACEFATITVRADADAIVMEMTLR